MAGEFQETPAPARAVADADEQAADQIADQIKRGVCRALAALGRVSLTEFSLSNRRRADVIALGAGGEITIIEVKSSQTDFQADQKWPEYLDFCDQFFFAVTTEFPLLLLPDDHGLWVADSYGAEELRPAPVRPLHASRRRALTLRIARVAAKRLHQINDPWR